jgi:integrase
MKLGRLCSPVLDSVRRKLNLNIDVVAHGNPRLIDDKAESAEVHCGDKKPSVIKKSLRQGSFDPGRAKGEKQARIRAQVFTREQLFLFLKAAHEFSPRYFSLFFLLARTGLRIGEALALQIGDLDF